MCGSGVARIYKLFAEARDGRSQARLFAKGDYTGQCSVSPEVNCVGLGRVSCVYFALISVLRLEI